jgi:outer membrane protein assembly factor BamD (BamD/ComL family)
MHLLKPLNQSFIRLFTIGILATLLVTSCSSPEEKAASRIAGIEKKLQNTDNPATQEELQALLSEYISFYESYPKDSAASQYLYRAINLSMGMGQGEKTMELIDKSINDYPNQPKLAEVVFLKAYVYENLLSDYGKAASIYRGFSSRFPNHPLANDAEAAIRNMGKSPEELVKEFEARNKVDSLKVNP